MAKQEKLLESLRNLGVEPIENRCIVIQFAATNLSAKVVSFLIREEPYYILQICKEELLIAPLKWTGSLKDEQPLKIGLSTVKEILVKQQGLNYKISIDCEEGIIDLIAQQKELTAFRSSGVLSLENVWGTKFWHSRNLDATLCELKKYQK